MSFSNQGEIIVVFHHPYVIYADFPLVMFIIFLLYDIAIVWKPKTNKKVKLGFSVTRNYVC